MLSKASVALSAWARDKKDITVVSSRDMRLSIFVAHSSACRDISFGGHHVPGLNEVAGEHPQTVATHLSDRAVSVAIIHKPQVWIAIPVLDVTGPQGL